MHRQQGITLSGFLLWAIVLIVALLLGLKVGPAYFEYYTIQKQLKEIAADPASGSGDRHEIEGAFAKRATIEDIHSIAPSDIQITREGNHVVLSASYTVRIPLVGNASACLDFNPSSAN